MKPLKSTLTAALLLSLTPAAQAADRHRLDVRGGRLGDAVVQLGRQAGVSIGISDPALANRRVRAVKGAMTAEQALRQLLRGSGARHVEVGSRAYRIVQQPARTTRTAPPQQRQIIVQAAPPAPEQEEPEIIVTGTRRGVHLSSYPGGFSLVEGDDPALAGGIRGSEALLDRLPQLSSTHLGPGRNKLFIRGIADSSFNGPTQATAGQYLGETRLNYNAPDPDLRLYDIDRIEVLEGPQGTLYGAGSLGGIIRILPNKPRADGVAGTASVGGSITQHGDPGADAGAMLNLPLVEDRLALRISGYGVTEGGYVDDRLRGLEDVNRVRTLGGRAALRLQAPADWTLDIGTTGQRIRGEDGQYADRDAPPLTRASAVDQPFSSDYFLADLAVEKRWGGTHFVTALGYVKQRLAEQYEATRAGERPQVFGQESEITLLSAESRLSRHVSGGTGWVVGTSLISNEAEQRREVGPVGAPVPITGVRNAILEAALFGEGSIRLLDDLIFTAGARLTHSRLSGTALDVALPILELLRNVQADRNQTAFLPSVALAWEAAPGLTLFGRYQESFRPGGLAVSESFINRFRNDDLSTMEAGVRYGQPGRSSFDASAAVAYTDWKNIQADTITMSGFPTTANIGDGRIYTFDARLGWRPIDGLRLEAAGTFNDSRVTAPGPNVDLVSTFSLPNVADFSGRVSAEYEAALANDLDLRLNAAARYTGKSRLGIGAILGEEQGEWLDLSLGAQLARRNHALSLTVSNLLDEVGNRFALGSPFTIFDQRQITPMRPRTVRIGWQVAF